jgi:hypothetical protein
MFGMLSKDCKALERFKKQKMILKRGRVLKETVHFTVDEIKSVKISKKQYEACLNKLLYEGSTAEELSFFNTLNNQ